MEKMLFDNPVFHRGLNFTVRLGTKWVEKLAVGDVFLAAGKKAIVRVVTLRELGKLQDDVFVYEHDPVCRVWDGLVRTLISKYPELESLSREELMSRPICCIGFEVLNIGHLTDKELIERRLAIIKEKDALCCQYGAISDGRFAFYKCTEHGRFLLSYSDVTLFLCQKHFYEMLPYGDGDD